MSTTANMPYNTRRKSLSLPSLGIHVPVTHAARAAARLSPPSTTLSSDVPPSKKLKRSHDETESMSPLPKQDIKFENTPPPSPKSETADAVEEVKPREIELDGINDDIVETVIVQLQRTGNRPHLVKELATILHHQVKIVETSANPAAIISSRLSSYLKRSWTAASPCPLAKELETVHPRRTYFYLTTYPHQPIPDSQPLHFPQRAIISPSLSSTESQNDETEAERRRELSPSPEVDLSVHEIDDVHESATLAIPSSIGSYSNPVQPQRNTRASSPPLEKDEKEFTQTARGMQKKKMSGSDAQVSGVPSEMADHPTRQTESDAFFGESRMLNIPATTTFASSPAMRPSVTINTSKRPLEESNLWSKADGAMEWDMRSPESVGIEELDGMLDDF